MSYYFTIIGTRDNPLFELDFGTSKLGGDGVARFRDEAKHMNQFIVHSSLDLVEEAQWSTKELYAENANCLLSDRPLMFKQISEEDRHFPELTCTRLSYRRQCQVHVAHES